MLAEQPQSFQLSHLLHGAFAPRTGERIALLIDLPEPERLVGWAYLNDAVGETQRLAHEAFHQPLHDHVLRELGLEGGDVYAYRTTGGSNLDLPATVIDLQGNRRALGAEVGAENDIILCLSTHSATAPLLALARAWGFRGATLHGIDRRVLETGLAADYERVDRETRRFQAGLQGADRVTLRFTVLGREATLEVDTRGRRVGTSKGRALPGETNVENLPDGEVYFLPRGAEGSFPHRYPDGTLALLTVRDGAVVDGEVLRGDPDRLAEQLARIQSDPNTGVVCELGFGTQPFPLTGCELQDEKILGTLHLATGRCDHLGGELGPGQFRDPRNATHDDLLYNRLETPEIEVPEVRVHWGERSEVLLENEVPAPYLRDLLAAGD